MFWVQGEDGADADDTLAVVVSLGSSGSSDSSEVGSSRGKQTYFLHCCLSNVHLEPTGQHVGTGRLQQSCIGSSQKDGSGSIGFS